MEKTIIINIGNTIIHIEESAYELLKAYLNEVKQYFANHADDLEIVTDIENRIAELLTEQLEEQKKQVVDSANVNSVIGRWVSVQDFDNAEPGEEEPVVMQAYRHNMPEKALPRYGRTCCCRCLCRYCALCKRDPSGLEWLQFYCFSWWIGYFGVCAALDYYAKSKIAY